MAEADETGPALLDCSAVPLSSSCRRHGEPTNDTDAVPQRIGAAFGARSDVRS
jgi:hypothetical protein